MLTPPSCFNVINLNVDEDPRKALPRGSLSLMTRSVKNCDWVFPLLIFKIQIQTLIYYTTNSVASKDLILESNDMRQTEGNS